MPAFRWLQTKNAQKQLLPGCTACMADSSIRKKQPFGWLFWISLGLFVIYILQYVLAGYLPDWIERSRQRRQVFERVQSALKRDCDGLAIKYKDTPYGLTWRRGDTNSLPPAIAVLEPKGVEFYSRNELQQLGFEAVRFEGSNVVVRIAIFGAHSTGGHDEPGLGLDVLCEPGVASYAPHRLRSTTPLRFWRYRKIADDIYEFY
jgi:hypothetical protein